jgi:hypothetical protein
LEVTAVMEELKYYKHPIYRKGKLAYKAYVAMDYLHKKEEFDIYVYIKKKFLGLFWIRVHEFSTRNLEPELATRKAIGEFENHRKKEKYDTFKLNTHIINFMGWDGELDKKKS